MHKTFLSCDWGTSSFRLRLIDVLSGEIVAASSSDEGVAKRHAAWTNAGKSENERVAFYTAVLQNHITRIEHDTGIDTNHMAVILSGMASSSIGMNELPYAQLPFALTGEDLQYKKVEKTDSFPHGLVIVSGASTATDVMRGEETQLLGCAANEIAANQIFIFTGTHSKHVVTSDGKAVSLKTHMTGEFFELLSKKSILSASIEEGSSLEENGNTAAFEQGVKDSLDQNLLHASFMVRTNQLFKKFSKTANYFYLSGLLIGAELSHLSKENADSITIVGDEKLVSGYLLALKMLNVEMPVSTMDATTATIRGHVILYRQLY